MTTNQVGAVRNSLLLLFITHLTNLFYIQQFKDKTASVVLMYSVYLALFLILNVKFLGYSS